jgi:hypothetical protein
MFADLTTVVYSFVLCAFLIQRSITLHMCISLKQACGTGITTGLSAEHMHIHGVISLTTQAFTACVA